MSRVGALSTQGQKFTWTASMTVVVCSACGIGFGIEEGHRLYWLDHPEKNFYCPNGHSQHYPGPTEKERAIKRAEFAEREAANLRDVLTMETLSHRATKGKLTKMTKRVSNGVCPCCNRTFANVARHMGTQHPDFAPGGSGRSQGDG